MLAGVLAPLTSPVVVAPHTLIADAVAGVDCVVEPAYTWVHLDYSTIAVNNLGGQYSDTEPELMEWRDVASTDGKTLMMQVRAKNISTGLTSDYEQAPKALREKQNGVRGTTGFGTININSPEEADSDVNHVDTTNYVDLEFCFKNQADDTPVAIPLFEFSIVDVDSGKNIKNGGRPKECITARGMKDFVLANNTEIDYEVISEGPPADQSLVQFCSKTPAAAENNPNDPMNMLPEHMALTVVLNYTDTSCFGLRFLSTCCAKQGRNFLFAGKTSVTPKICDGPPMAPPKPPAPPPFVPPTPISVHGDPMLKVHGEGTHFFIKPDELTPILSWVSKDKREMQLLGRTVADEGTAHQWFKEIVVAESGQPAISVVAQDPTDFCGLLHCSAMDIMLNGTPLQPETRSGLTADGHSFSLEDLPRNEQRLLLEASGLSLELVSAPAKKFDQGSPDQTLYHHLDLKFSRGLPHDASGVLAEISGARPMSAATAAMIHGSSEFAADFATPPLVDGIHFG